MRSAGTALRGVLGASMLVLAAAGGTGRAEEPLPDRFRLERPEIEVRRLPRAPVLEDFLGMRPPADLAELMPPITGFVQRQPEDGRPASQRTETYMGYDDEHLYVVFVAWDEEPHKIRAHLSRREQVFSDETVEIQIDTYDDEQRAFSFLTNPFGIQWDAIWTEGQGFDMSWDTVWHSRGELTDEGYVVWMAIPFKSLRFRPLPPEERHTWNVILVRDIPRNNETSFWPPVSARVEGRLNQSARARGFAGVAPGRNLWLIPYAAAGRDEVRTRADEEPTPFQESDVGLDLKWVIRDAFALDVTANPNFAQVESDEPQVTVNERFEVYYPERRPFFLENADYFRTPFDLLFTRRIQDPDFGARLTGQAGAYKLGVLAIDDAAPGKRAEPGSSLDGENALNGIVRVRRDLPNQSNVGFLWTDRELADAHNRVAGVDSRIKLDDNWDTRLQAVWSSTRLVDEETGDVADLSDPAYSFELNRAGRTLETHLHYREVGPEFRTALGFVPRSDIRDPHGHVGYSFWHEGRTLIRTTPSLFAEYITNHDGVRLDRNVLGEVEWELRGQTELSLFGRTGRVRLLAGEDYPAPAPASLDFPADEIGVRLESRFVTAVELELEYEQGRTVNFFPVEGALPSPAERRALEAQLTLRLGRHWRVGGAYLRTDLDDEAGGARVLTDRIARLRLDWQFDRRLWLRAIVQQDHTDPDPALSGVQPRDDVNADLLLTYLINPWTAIYLGYNTNRTRTELDQDGRPVYRDDAYTDSRLVFVKLSYLFRP